MDKLDLEQIGFFLYMQQMEEEEQRRHAQAAVNEADEEDKEA